MKVVDKGQSEAGFSKRICGHGVQKLKVSAVRVILMINS